MTFSAILYDIILLPITQVIEIAYRVFFQLFKNTGVAVIGVSLAVTLLCLPLYMVSEGWEATERKIQEKMRPGIDRIKKAFSGDERYMILSTFYQQNHYHPIMTLRSSFGILIQIPFFLAAYHTLSSLSDLQGSPFLFVRDMGKPDALFSVGSFTVNVLPVAMTLINCVSGIIYSRGHGVREKVQIFGMAAVFLVVLYNSPAGLVLYWTFNNIFSLVKNVFYKLRNPAQVLYKCFFAAVLCLIAFIWFFYSRGAEIEKKLPATIFLLLVLPVPFYVRAAEWLFSGVLGSFLSGRRLRLSVFALSALALVVLTGLALPSSLIASSTQEFADIESYTNPCGFLHSSFWMSFGLIIFWPFCFFFLFKEKIQTLMAALFPFLLFAGILNAYVFSGNFGSMDATLKFIDGMPASSLIRSLLNVVLLAVLFVALLALIRFGNQGILPGLCAISLMSFVALSVVNIHKINSDYAEYKRIARADGDAPDDFAAKYHLSKTQRNIIVLMFDRMEGSYLPYILKDCPGIGEKLSGFTYYPNTVSFNGHTLMASPAVYGGYEYTPMEMNRRSDVPLKDKHNEALSLLPLILGEAGFESTVSDLSWANYSWIADMSFAKDLPRTNAISVLSRYTGDFKREFLRSPDSLASMAHILNRNLFWVSVFRESPVLLRPVVYYKGTWWESGVKATSSSFVDWYSAFHYLTKITAIDSDAPTLNIITNEATHSSEDISMYDLPLGETNSLPEESSYPANVAVMNTLAALADFLKENGVYDNTRILLASDHGVGNGRIAKEDYTTPDIDGYLKDHFHCILLEKDFGSTGPLRTDDQFMTNADVPALALKGIVDDARNPFTGKEISIAAAEEYKKDGVAITRGDLFMPGHSRSKYQFTLPDESWFIVKDNIFDDGNWRRLYPKSRSRKD